VVVAAPQKLLARCLVADGHDRQVFLDQAPFGQLAALAIASAGTR
jgi:hypothetical protein